jgi:hypothetical protein
LLCVKAPYQTNYLLLDLVLVDLLALLVYRQTLKSLMQMQRSMHLHSMQEEQGQPQISILKTSYH